MLRVLLAVAVLGFGSVSFGHSVRAADEVSAPSVSAPASVPAEAPHCEAIQLDGKSTMACFNLTDDQASDLGGGTEDFRPFHHCEVRCEDWDFHHRCRRWHRVCW